MALIEATFAATQVSTVTDSRISSKVPLVTNGAIRTQVISQYAIGNKETSQQSIDDLGNTKRSMYMVNI